jgi:hypothetical protein
MENASERTQAAAPGRIENLLVAIAVIENLFPKQQVQMVMAILVDHIVDQIEAVPVEAVNKGEAWSMAITEADDALRLERDDPSGQEREDLLSFRPGLFNDGPGPRYSRDLIR